MDVSTWTPQQVSLWLTHQPFHVLQDLKHKIDTLSKLHSPRHVPPSSASLFDSPEQFYHALSLFLSSRYTFVTRPWSQFRHSSYLPILVEQLRRLEPFVKKLPTLTLAQEHALVSWALLRLSDRTPYSFKEFLTKLHHVPLIVDEAFPNYIMNNQTFALAIYAICQPSKRSHYVRKKSRPRS